MTPHLLGDPPYRIGVLVLRATEGREAADLAARIAALDPWHRLGYTAAGLRAYLTRPDPGARRFVLVDAGQAVGAAVIRDPWLRGPYIELLALFAEAQGRGLGGAFVDWLAARAGRRDRNLWVVASAVNDRALDFYRRHGFAPVGELDGLVRDGEREILLRRRLG